jgi:hypothetical protein
MDRHTLMVLEDAENSHEHIGILYAQHIGIYTILHLMDAGNVLILSM